MKNIKAQLSIHTLQRDLSTLKDIESHRRTGRYKVSKDGSIVPKSFMSRLFSCMSRAPGKELLLQRAIAQVQQGTSGPLQKRLAGCLEATQSARTFEEAASKVERKLEGAKRYFDSEGLGLDLAHDAEIGTLMNRIQHATNSSAVKSAQVDLEATIHRLKLSYHEDDSRRDLLQDILHGANQVATERGRQLENDREEALIILSDLQGKLTGLQKIPSDQAKYYQVSKKGSLQRKNWMRRLFTWGDRPEAKAQLAVDLIAHRQEGSGPAAHRLLDHYLETVMDEKSSLDSNLSKVQEMARAKERIYQLQTAGLRPEDDGAFGTLMSDLQRTSSASEARDLQERIEETLISFRSKYSSDDPRRGLIEELYSNTAQTVDAKIIQLYEHEHKRATQVLDEAKHLGDVLTAEKAFSKAEAMIRASFPASHPELSLMETQFAQDKEKIREKAENIFKGRLEKLQETLKEVQTIAEHGGATSDFTRITKRFLTSLRKSPYVSRDFQSSCEQKVAKMRAEYALVENAEQIKRFVAQSLNRASFTNIGSARTALEKADALKALPHLTEEQKEQVTLAKQRVIEGTQKLILAHISHAPPRTFSECCKQVIGLREGFTELSRLGSSLPEEKKLLLKKSLETRKTEIERKAKDLVMQEAGPLEKVHFSTAPTSSEEAQNRHDQILERRMKLERATKNLQSVGIVPPDALAKHIQSLKACEQLLRAEQDVMEMEARLGDPDRIASILSNPKELKRLKRDMQYLASKLHKRQKLYTLAKGSFPHLGSTPAAKLMERASQCLEKLDPSSLGQEDFDLTKLLSVMWVLFAMMTGQRK